MYEFFNAVFGAAPPASLWVARIDRRDREDRQFYQRRFLFPQQSSYLYDQIEAWKQAKNDVYFCPHLFFGERRKADVVPLVTCAWADLDTCQPCTLKVKPSILWQTSPGKHSALWLLKQEVDALEAAHLSKRIAYYHKANGCDTSGHDITQLLRVPGTRNYKYSGAPRVELIDFDPKNLPLYELNDFNEYPDVPRPSLNAQSIEGLPPTETMKYSELPYVVKILFQRAQAFRHKAQRGEYDRSKMVVDMINLCRREGLTKGQTSSILEKFPPFIGRIEDDGVGWIVKAKLFNQVDVEHPHEGTTCSDANCERMSNYDRMSRILIKLGR